RIPRQRRTLDQNVDSRCSSRGVDSYLSGNRGGSGYASLRWGTIHLGGTQEERWRRSLKRLLHKTIWTGWGRITAIAGRSYMAGPELSDALRAAQQFGDRGFRSTICYWNAGSDGPETVAANYLAALEGMTRERLDGYLSVKAPALGYDETLIKRIVRRAA